MNKINWFTPKIDNINKSLLKSVISSNFISEGKITQKLEVKIGKFLKIKNRELKERAIDKKTTKVVVKVSKTLFRPNEIDHAYGSSSKANNVLKWKPKTNLKQLVKLMVDFDENQIKNA